MNTIKIYLDASGAVAQLQKDFPLYQFQYNNKLVNIYVPTSICAGPFIDDNITVGYVCTMSMKATDWNGVSKQTGAYALRYLKTLTHNGIEYALFERALPYAFTLYAGQDQTAPEITISVLNVASGSLLSIINSQTVSIDIMESNDAFDIDYTEIEPTAAQELQAQIDAITAKLALKLNADTTNDNNKVNPNGDNHIVVDNINALIEATEDLPDLEMQVDQNTADIADLKTLSIYGWNVVGTHEIVSQSAQDDNAIPSDADLISWIEALKGSAIAKGDAIFIYWDNFASADDVSLFWYAGTEQNGSKFRQVPYMIHMAGNSVAGLIEGTYRTNLTGQADKLMVDIVDGQVVNVYKVKHDESGLVSLKDVIDQAYAKLIANTQAVEMAVKDANGNIITSTYMTINAGATKKYVQDYASPKALYDLNYPDYATDEFKKENVNDNSYNKTTNSTSIGYTPLSVIGKNLEADILLGDQNGLVNRLWLNATHTENIKLRITTAYADADNVAQTLSIVETESFQVTANTPILKQIESVFSGLTTPITLPSGTPISQTIEVWREDSTSADFTLLCNETYNAYMTFNKIGFVRYSLEAEPDAIVSGHDSAPYLDSNGDLVITSTDGEINYMNGESAPLSTILKVPMVNDLYDLVHGAIKPVTAGVVADALEGTVITKEMISSNLNFTTTPILLNTVSADNFLKFKNAKTAIYKIKTNDVIYDLRRIEDAVGLNDDVLTFKARYNDDYNLVLTLTYDPQNQIAQEAYYFEESGVLQLNVKNFIISEYDKTLNLFDPSNATSDNGFSLRNLEVGKTYTFSFNASMAYIKISTSVTSSAIQQWSNASSASFEYTNAMVGANLYITSDNINWDTIASLVSSGYEPMLVEGSTAHAYIPYNGAIVHEKEFQDRTQKSLYNLGAFDSVTDNGNGTVAIARKTGYVRLEELSWTYNSQYNYWEAIIAGNPALKPADFNTKANIKCNNYVAMAWNNAIGSGNGIALSPITGDTYVAVDNASSTTKPSGLLEFELASATTENLIKDEQVKFQTPIQAKVVNFNQLVTNEYIKYNGISGNVFFATNLTVGHKYYMRIDITYNATANQNGIFCTNTAFTNYDRLFLVASTGRLETTFTANYTNYATRCNDAMNWENNVCIDLTAMGLDNLTLAQCQALFNADYYNYTSGNDMQLIYDGEKPIALVDIPQQYPRLIVNESGNVAITQGQSNIIYTKTLEKGKYMVFAYSKLTSIQSWFSFNLQVDGTIYSGEAGSGNNGGGLALSDYIEKDSSFVLKLESYGYSSYTQQYSIRIVKVG